MRWAILENDSVIMASGTSNHSNGPKGQLCRADTYTIRVVLKELK